MARFGDGLATGTDLVGAAERAVLQALEPLGGAPDLLCVFVCGEDADEITQAGERAMSLAPGAVTIGCTANGIVGQGRAVEGRGGVSAWAARLPDTTITPVRLEVEPEDEYLTVVGMVEPTPADSAMILLANPYAFPVPPFLRYSSESMGGLPIVGGLAGTLRGEESMRLFSMGESVDAGAVGVLLGGEGVVGAAVSQGCSPIGPALAVTGAEGNVITEIAGVPAVAKLEEIVDALTDGERALASRGLQIGIAMDEYAERHGYGDFLIRGVVDADPETGELIIAEVVEVGQTIRFHVRDSATAESDLSKKLHTFHTDTDGRSDAALLFTCNGRGASMFPTADHDVRQIRHDLGITPVAGYFAPGEIGPVAGRNYMHGFTACVLTFGP